MEYIFTYQIVTGICFSDQEFEFLTKSITQNAEMSYVTKQGHFWHGNITRRAQCPIGLRNKFPTTITIKQLDKYLLKSLQPYALDGYGDPEEVNFAANLYFLIHKILEDALLEIKILNESGLHYRVVETKERNNCI